MHPGAQPSSTIHQLRNSRREFLLSTASLLCARLALGQDEPTFSTDVKVVNVLATVRTKKNEIVRDLTKDDFLLSENGRLQTIRYFSRESELPLTVGLMIDTSMSQQRVLESERSASFRFLDQVLRESKDKLFVMQFDMAVQLRQPLTSSRKDLEEILPYVDTPTRRELNLQNGGGTLLYDAIVQASNSVLKNQRNRKAMIVLSDGGENGSTATLTDAIEAAQRADTLVYSILFADRGFLGPSLAFGPEGRGILMRLSKETGASFFEVSKKQGIEQIYETIQEELRSQYNLGFISDQPGEISEFRALKLTTKQKGLIVQSRERYWAKA
ncbi:MAG TPA: VWA domain-containing protein [Bryobacteraceae bacterium]|nr:VWA domain-containing protein [Bryobacteraceae bacterium]